MKAAQYSTLAFPSTEGFIVASKVNERRRQQARATHRAQTTCICSDCCLSFVCMCICTCGFNTFHLSEFFTYPNPNFFFLPKGVRITEDLLYSYLV